MRRGGRPNGGPTDSDGTEPDDGRPEIEYDPDASRSVIPDDLVQFVVRNWGAEWNVEGDTPPD